MTALMSSVEPSSTISNSQPLNVCAMTDSIMPLSRSVWFNTDVQIETLMVSMRLPEKFNECIIEGLLCFSQAVQIHFFNCGEARQLLRVIANTRKSRRLLQVGQVINPRFLRQTV